MLWSVCVQPRSFNIFSPSTSNLVLGRAVFVLSWAIGSNDWASFHFDAMVFAWCWGGHMRMTWLSPRRFSCCEGAVHKSLQLARDLVVNGRNCKRPSNTKCCVCCTTMFTETCTCNPIFSLDLVSLRSCLCCGVILENIALATTPFH